jgi:hypothetical protein
MDNLLEYPILQIKSDEDFIRESICKLWFNLSRKNDGGLKLFGIELFDVLTKLKTKIKTNGQFMEYLKLLFCMIAHTRDIAFGRGEMDITYSMIYTWYRVFPVLAVYALEILVQSSGNGDLSYGSWKDISRLCEFIKKETRNDEHPLIITAIEMANKQLRRDITKTRNGDDNISNVCKWIPREKSKRGWLFDMFVKDFYPVKNFYPRMHSYDDLFEKRVKTFSWNKAKYRKLLSELNARIDTTEIKLCQNKWSHIDFFTPFNIESNVAFSLKNSDNVGDLNVKRSRNINQGSLKKYWNAFMNIGSDTRKRHQSLDRLECSQRALYYAQTTFGGEVCLNKYSHSFFCGNVDRLSRSGFYSVGEFVKMAIELYEKRKTVEPLSLNSISNQYETNLLNTMWNQFSLRVGKPLGSTIPILDVSLSMASSRDFYAAIGYAYLISENSDINSRIIAFSHQTEWISYDNMGFVDDIYNIITQFPSSSNKRFDGVSYLLQAALDYSGHNLNEMNFVLISDFTQEHVLDNDFFVKNIIRWNLSSYYGSSINSISPIGIVEYSKPFVSGDSLSSFWQLCNIISKDVTQFDIIRKTLNHIRYAPVRDLFCKIIAL